MTAIEEMAGMDVLCSDKTGTLTLNKLTVDKNLIEAHIYSANGGDCAVFLSNYDSKSTVGVQTSKLEMLPSNIDINSWETYNEDISSMKDSSAFTNSGLLKQINVTRDASDYLCSGLSRKYWSLKLDEAVWAYRTTYKTPLGMSPFHLVYGKRCHLPVELEHKAYWALKKLNLDLDAAGKKRMLQLNELDEF
ncbi:hypothetical protein AgCh_034005 [Apium graveolens]